MSVSQGSLSKHWNVVRQHESFFTGGKVAPLVVGSRVLHACLNDGAVAVVDLQTGQKITSASSHDDPIASFCVHPLGTSMVVSCSSLLLKHLPLTLPSESSSAEAHREDSVAIRSWRGHQLPVLDMTFDPSGTLVATASSDRSVKVWNVAGGFCTHKLRGHSSIVQRVFFHPDGRRLEVVSCALDGEMRVWDLVTKRHVVLHEHLGAVSDVAFSSAGDHMYSAGRDQVVNIWFCGRNKLRGAKLEYSHVRTLPVLEALSSIVSLGGSGGGPASFATAGDEGTVKLWTAGSSLPVKTLNLSPQSRIEDSASSVIDRLIFHEKLGEVVAVTGDQLFHVLGLSGTNLCHKKSIVGQNDEIIDLKYLVGGKHVIIATNSEQIRVVNIETLDSDTIGVRGPKANAETHSDVVLSIDVTLDGSLVVSGSKDSSVRLWRLVESDVGRPMPQFQCVAIGRGHTEAVGAVSIPSVVSKAQLPFAASGSRDRTLKIWKLPSAEVKEPVAMAVASSVVAHEKDINALAIAPDNKLLASGSQDKTTKLWSVSAKGELEHRGTLTGHRRGVWGVEFSPVEKVIATCSGDKTVRLWSTSDYSCLRTLQGHTNSVLKVKFLCAGLQLLSSGADGVIKLWNVRSNEVVNTFVDNHRGKVWAVDVSPDGTHFVSGDAESVLNVWRDDTEHIASTLAEEEEKFVLQEQKLASLERTNKHIDAARLALRLDLPRKLLGLLWRALEESGVAALTGDEETAISTDSVSIDNMVKALCDQRDADDLSQEDLLLKLFRHIREWNTNSRQSHVAQGVLASIFRVVPPSVMKNVLRSSQGGVEILNSMLVYTERHSQRVDSLLQRSFLIDYTYQRMNIVSPVHDIALGDSAGPLKRRKL